MEQKVSISLDDCIYVVYIASRREHAIENAAKHYSHDHAGEKGNIIP